MNLNLAPWYYKKLLEPNSIIENPTHYVVHNILNEKYYESNVSLKNYNSHYNFAKSDIYNNCDGSGADKFKNIAVYKAISEALERLAFYESIDTKSHEFCFDLNPTTTGMAAYPYLNYSKARNNAKNEAIERWAIHEFNKHCIPIIKIDTLIENLEHYELVTPYRKTAKVSLLVFKKNSFYSYGFAGASTIEDSFTKALVELSRNIKILLKDEIYNKSYKDFLDATDRTMLYYSTVEGYSNFQDLIKNAPSKVINSNPKIICDNRIVGRWSEYTKVWRFLLEDSYFPTSDNYKFFMF